MKSPALRRGSSEDPARTSEVLAEVLASVPAPRVAAGWLADRLRRRAFGILLLALGALALIPGIATIAGVLMFIPAFQMIFGRPAPVLPGAVRRLSVPSRWLTGETARRITGAVARVERLVRPRLAVLTRPPFENLVGVLVAGLALAVLVPLPLVHMVPALAVIVIALGFLEHDGLVLIVGTALGAGIAYGGLLVWNAVLRIAGATLGGTP